MSVRWLKQSALLNKNKEEQELSKLPHPIPYQGSKRALASSIFQFVPTEIETWYEPFCGSAAMTVYAASRGAAQKYVIGDSLEPIVKLIKNIVEDPGLVSSQYQKIWLGQGNDNPGYFNEIRDRYNEFGDSIDLLYLICRCVKNAVRFGVSGRFTQSHDKRRLGVNPKKMHEAVHGMSRILQGKVEYRCGDWLETLADVTPADFVYMDPPYFGTSEGRDKRYFSQLSQASLIEGLRSLNCRHVRFALSYDGMTGGREYAPPLPDDLLLVRKLLHAGRSSQSTLNGKSEDTIESLYLSTGLNAEGEHLIDALNRFSQPSFNL